METQLTTFEPTKAPIVLPDVDVIRERIQQNHSENATLRKILRIVARLPGGDKRLSQVVCTAKQKGTDQ